MSKNNPKKKLENMSDSKAEKKKDIISSLFFKLLPVQVAIIAMSSINSIVDGAVAGRFIDSSSVGVIGLYYPMVQILSGIGAILLGGTSVLIGKYMGRGNMDRTKGVYTLNMIMTIVIGGIIMIASALFSRSLAEVLGTTPELKDDLVKYILGYSLGIIPLLIAQQLGFFLQLERKSNRNYIGVAFMIVANIAIDIIFVSVLDMGIFGLALATSICNMLYALILGGYYFHKDAQLKFNIKLVDWREIWDIIQIGFPGALLVICLALRGGVLNRLLLTYGGNDGLSAMASYNMIGGLFMAYCIGAGMVVRTLGSVFIGEEDKHSIKHLIKIVFSRGLAVTIVIAVLIVLLSGFFASIFFPDTASNVYAVTRLLIIINGCCIPLILVCCVFSNYLQAMDHKLYVNFLSIFDGFIAMIVPAVILAPIFGLTGIWLAVPIGIILTMLLTPLYCILFWKRIPRNIDEWMFFKPDFGVSEKDAMDMRLNSMDDVVSVSEKVQDFCMEHGLDAKTSYYSALCLEEMAGNIVDHGFNKDNKKHVVDTHVIYKNGRVLLRIKDDCVPFNPQERANQMSEEDPTKHMGIRMVMNMADDVTYNTVLGLNVLTIILDNKAVRE